MYGFFTEAKRILKARLHRWKPSVTYALGLNDFSDTPTSPHKSDDSFPFSFTFSFTHNEENGNIIVKPIILSTILLTPTKAKKLQSLHEHAGGSAKEKC